MRRKKKEIEKRQEPEQIAMPKPVDEEPLVKTATSEDIEATVTTADEADTFLQFDETGDKKTDESDEHHEGELHVISEEIDI